MTNTITTIFLLIVFHISVLGNPVLAEVEVNGCPQISTQGWSEDIDFIFSQIKERHAEPFWAISEEEFAGQVRALKNNLENLNGCQVVVGLYKLTALLQDGHSTPLSGSVSGTEENHFFPLWFYDFSDGLFLIAVDKSLSELAGAKVLKIGGVPAKEAWGRLMESTRGDNNQSRRSIGKFRLQDPYYVHGLGLSKDVGEVFLLVRTLKGEEKELRVTALGKKEGEEVDWAWGRPLVGKDGPLVFRDRVEESSTEPLGMDFQDYPDKYWFTYLPDINAVYVKMNSVTNKAGYSFGEFTKDVFAYIDENNVDRLILDISRNGGGNGTIILPFLHEVIKRDRINQRGHFFTITGRNTFSAAQIFAGFLKRHTNSLFVGEPTGGSQIHYGEPRPITLPNSGIRVVLSTNMYQNTWPWDARARMSIFPDLTAEFSSSDFFGNRDVVMAAILDFIENPWEPLQEALASLVSEREFKKAKELFHSHRESHPDRYGLSIEADLNRLGYSLKGRGDLEGAIFVFQLNTEAYPESPNVWDSLAEAYLEKGNNELALKYYRKAVTLNPNNENAKKIIRELTDDQDLKPPKKPG